MTNDKPFPSVVSGGLGSARRACLAALLLATGPVLCYGGAPPSKAPKTSVGISRKMPLSVLVDSLKDKDENIRAKAAEDLGRLRPAAAAAVGPLIEALRDRAATVRYRAAESLERIGTPSARKAVYAFRQRLARDKKSW